MASFVVWNAEFVFVAAPNTNVSLLEHLKKKIDSLVRRKDFVLSHLASPIVSNNPKSIQQKKHSSCYLALLPLPAESVKIQKHDEKKIEHILV
jgi:hypothetical protein